MPNDWTKQVFLQEFYLESINFKNSVKIFEPMEIVELVEPSTKKLTGTDHKHAVLRKKTRGR